MQTTKQAQVKGAIHQDNPILFHAKNKKKTSHLYIMRMIRLISCSNFSHGPEKKLK